MTLFVFFIFVVYGGVHVYAFLKARQAFGFGWAAGVVVALFMAFMVGAVFLIRSLERHDFELTRPHPVLDRLPLDGGHLPLLLQFPCLRPGESRCSGCRHGSERRVRFSGAFRRGFSFACLSPSSALICVYGYFDAQNIRTERLVFETDRLPKGTDKVTIAQISDVHLGLIVRCDRLVAMLEAVKAAKPDICRRHRRPRGRPDQRSAGPARAAAGHQRKVRQVRHYREPRILCRHRQGAGVFPRLGAHRAAGRIEGPRRYPDRRRGRPDGHSDEGRERRRRTARRWPGPTGRRSSCCS